MVASRERLVAGLSRMDSDEVIIKWPVQRNTVSQNNLLSLDEFCVCDEL